MRAARNFSLLIVWLAVLVLLAPAARAADDDGFVPLFDGKDLAGWTQRGGKAKYRVEDDTIVGTTEPNTPNSFLCTDKNYANFILEVDFKVDDGLNSGIQIRSHAYEQDTPDPSDPKRIHKAGRVHGYQVEIDTNPRAWTGGIYDEGRRGWLNDLKENEPARKAFRHNEWNHFRIVADGDSIKTWLNEVPAADLHDTMTSTGFIALQVHGTKSDKPLHVRWRNIKIKTLP